jgi:hypothetical protein
MKMTHRRKRKTIENSLELRLMGWQAAARSPRTPAWLKPSLREMVRRAKKRLQQSRRRAARMERD